MILERQKLMLALLAANGGELDRVDFQKLLFLFTQQCEQNPSYEFVPFKKGCFSFTAMADKRGLVEKGLLADVEDWKLTDSGKEIAAKVPKDLRWKLTLFCDRRKQLRGSTLLTEVYRAYPYWATRSRIVQDILAGDDTALSAVEKAARLGPLRRCAPSATRAKRGRVFQRPAARGRVGSVRCTENAFSRKFGFSKAALERMCQDLDIRYKHVPSWNRIGRASVPE
jgi:hypothetical protein